MKIMIGPSILTPEVIRQIKKTGEEKCFICGDNMVVPLEGYENNYPLYYEKGNLNLFLTCDKGLLSSHELLIGKELFKDSSINYLFIGTIFDKEGLLIKSNTSYYEWRFHKKVIDYSSPTSRMANEIPIQIPWIDPNTAINSNIIDKLQKLAMLT